MDYQASSRSSKEIRSIRRWAFRTGIAVLLSFSCSVVFAQLAPNPLSIDVRISASVLANPNNSPPNSGPPFSPGPINMSGVVDSVIFKGIAYPGSSISVLENGRSIATLPANLDGTFELHVQNVSPGTYSFGVQAEDKNHLKSKLLTFTVYVASGIATTLDGIFIPPTLTSDYIEVKQGTPLLFSGSSVPNATIRLSLVMDSEIIKQSVANASGTWTYKLDTGTFALGDYEAKARSIIPNNLSPYSDPLSFRIGDTTRARSKAVSLSGFRKRCDLNDDGRVNLLDFSIMAFWYKRFGFPAKVDLNTDNRVNLTDLSILAYCWTG